MAISKVQAQVEKTRENILDAFAFLLIECGYECLTIKKIIARANIGRTTFYDYFNSKEELLRASVERMVKSLIAGKNRTNPQRRLEFTLDFFHHVGSEHGVYDTIVGRNDFLIIERYLRRSLSELVLQELQSTNGGRPSVVLEFAAQHVVGALLSMTIRWRENGREFAPEEINELFRTLTVPGLDAMLNDRQPTDQFGIG